MVQILTVKEVAKMLKMCPMTIYRMVSRGDIPYFKIGDDLRFRLEAIEAWIREKEKMNSPRKRGKR